MPPILSWSDPEILDLRQLPFFFIKEKHFENAMKAAERIGYMIAGVVLRKYGREQEISKNIASRLT
jgi:hypothetical protein